MNGASSSIFRAALIGTVLSMLILILSAVSPRPRYVRFSGSKERHNSACSAHPWNSPALIISAPAFTRYPLLLRSSHATSPSKYPHHPSSSTVESGSAESGLKKAKVCGERVDELPRNGCRLGLSLLGRKLRRPREPGIVSLSQLPCLYLFNLLGVVSGMA